MGRPAGTTSMSPGTGASKSFGVFRRLQSAWKAGYLKVSGEIYLLRSLLPPAMPDLSPEAVGKWPACREERFPTDCRIPTVATHGVLQGKCIPRPPPLPFDLALSLFAYEAEAREGIRAAKYDGRSEVARILALRFHEAIRGEWADRFPDGFRPMIVPVPIRPEKYYRRGYNFPALVALPLSRLTGWPCNLLLLRRVGKGPPQAGLPLSARDKNVRTAFSVRHGAQAPRDVTLLDDVYTSGATVSACARALKKAGAEHIVVLTVARAVL
jgi:ComF family protein